MYNWQLNASTGDYIHRINKNTRLVRMKGGGIYEAEYWGDHSLNYPVYGDWSKTPKGALENLYKVLNPNELAI